MIFEMGGSGWRMERIHFYIHFSTRSKRRQELGNAVRYLRLYANGELPILLKV